MSPPPRTTPALARPGARHRPRPTLAAWSLALLMAGCATVAPPPVSPTAPPARPPAPATAQPTPAPAAEAPASPAAPVPSPRTVAAEGLAIEQRWLQDWFRGTPVRIALRGDGVLAVEVPREFCFDSGRSQIKPALAAVLDKVAESLRRRPTTRLTLLAAPADPAGPSTSPAANPASATLAQQRAAGVQRHLRDRGIALARLGEPTADGAAAVQLRIGAAPR
ncbi:MAG: hypothetical protein C0505_17025 [Leptothrix sp. (in: Bacteria)]|nr:hypothetical protein [Leptothrix sp. (in: b-proteobacteria)]